MSRWPHLLSIPFYHDQKHRILIPLAKPQTVLRVLSVPRCSSTWCSKSKNQVQQRKRTVYFSRFQHLIEAIVNANQSALLCFLCESYLYHSIVNSREISAEHASESGKVTINPLSNSTSCHFCCGWYPLLICGFILPEIWLFDNSGICKLRFVKWRGSVSMDSSGHRKKRGLVVCWIVFKCFVFGQWHTLDDYSDYERPIGSTWMENSLVIIR